MGLESLQHNFLTGTLEGAVKWARASSSLTRSRNERSSNVPYIEMVAYLLPRRQCERPAGTK